MGQHSVTLLAAEEGGTSNFLIPNGTFFFVLAIFLIVLGVIAKFVVPPIQKVLGERENMVAKTTEDNRRSAELEAAAEADYRAELGKARAEAAAIRDHARAEGRAVIDERRGQANEHVAGVVAQANDELKVASDGIAGQLRSAAEGLSATLANRVIGVDVISSTSTASGR